MADISKKNKTWNRLALISTALCFGSIYAVTIVLMAGLLQPVALVLSVKAYKEIKKTGEKGKLLSQIVIFFSGIATIGMVIPILSAL